MKYGGFWIRSVSWFIDGIIVSIFFAIVHKLFDLSLGVHLQFLKGGTVDQVKNFYGSPDVMFLSILSIGISWIYMAGFMSSKWQATPGMRLLSLKVVDYTGERISFGRATVRYLASWVSGSLFMLGYIMVAFTPRKQSLHDYIAETLVLREE